MARTKTKKTLDAELATLKALKLPDLQRRFAEIVGEETRCPNKTYLLRRIREGLEARAAEAKAAKAESPTRDEQGPPLRDLDIDELRAAYVEIVGRETSSRDAAYLRWKIQQAQRGKVPVGPVGRRPPGAPPIDYKVLPLRMRAETVEALDDAWRRHGLQSRMDLFRRALDRYLSELGEDDAAAHMRGM